MKRASSSGSINHWKVFGFLFFYFTVGGVAQEIRDPVLDGAEPGRSYLVWKADINHDGIVDVLVNTKETEEEAEAQRGHPGGPSMPDDCYSFAVYLALKNGAYRVSGGVLFLTSRCFVGYIDAIKGYGILTLEPRIVSDPDVPQARHGILKMRIVCFTFDGKQMKEIGMTNLLDDWERHPLYKKYLTDAKRTKITMSEVKPKKQ